MRMMRMTTTWTYSSRVAAAALLVVALGLGACAGTKGEYNTPVQSGLVITGETLAGIGDQFANVGDVYKVQCTPAVTVAELSGFCSSFKTFGPQFQAAYPLAVKTFKAAAAAKDLAAAQGAESTILSLSTQLTAIAGQALAVMKKGK
jgi:hypothetical protein